MNNNLKPIGNPNDWHIEVFPKRAGDFGCISISSIKYNKNEAEQLAREIEEEITRHVDRVQGCSMVYNSWICQNCDGIYDTFNEANNCDCEKAD